MLTKGYNKFEKSERILKYLKLKSDFYNSENKRKTEENSNRYLKC